VESRRLLHTQAKKGLPCLALLLLSGCYYLGGLAGASCHFQAGVAPSDQGEAQQTGTSTPERRVEDALPPQYKKQGRKIGSGLCKSTVLFSHVVSRLSAELADIRNTVNILCLKTEASERPHRAGSTDKLFCARHSPDGTGKLVARAATIPYPYLALLYSKNHSQLSH